MITIGFKRTDDGVFVPHVDVLRNLNRIFRRAGVEVKYSNGFNKHMALKMTQPLPLGVVDNDAYVTVDVVRDIYPQKAAELFNSNCPPFLRAKSAFVTELNPSLAGAVNASSYRVKGRLTGEQAAAINSIRGEYEIETKTKDGAVVKNVMPLIYGLQADERGFSAILAFGNVNLRIDRLIESFNKNFGTEFTVTDATRVAQCIVKDGKLLTAAGYLEEICREKYISK